MIVIRKASAHGLGHLRAPYDEKDAPRDIPAPVVPLDEIEVERWQHDFWQRIIQAALKGPSERPDFSNLPGFNQPAVVRYAATTPRMLKGFRHYNRGKPYRQQIWPFNFMLMFLPDPLCEPPTKISGNISPAKARARKIDPGKARVLAPFHKDVAVAIEQAFDRDTGKPVPASSLKSYRRVLRTYHIHPEAKFENGDWGDIGPTTPRLIKVTAIRHIGKEAHHWEEEFLLGQDETQFDFGMAPAGHRKNLSQLRQAAKDFGHRVLAQAANISRQQLGSILNGKSAPRGSTQIKLGQAAAALSLVKADIDNVLIQLRECIRNVSIRRLADMADIDGGLLSRIVTGERRLSRTTLVKLKKGLALYASYSTTSAHMP